MYIGAYTFKKKYTSFLNFKNIFFLRGEIFVFQDKLCPLGT